MEQSTLRARNSSAPPLGSCGYRLRSLTLSVHGLLLAERRTIFWSLLRVAGGSFIYLTYVLRVNPFYVDQKRVHCTVSDNSSRSQLCKQLCFGTSMLSSILILQFTAQGLASRKSWYLAHVSMLQVIDLLTYKSLTSSTACNPPRSHLCLLSRDRTHSSRVAKVVSIPFSFPILESTTHARGTSSLDRRSPLTPATATSIMSCEGCSRRVSSISLGETCFPETFKIS